MKTLYLAGPMTGYPRFNYPTFAFISGVLRESGYEVFNPAEIDHIDENNWKKCIGAALNVLFQPNIEGLALIEGWETSRGAQIEKLLADGFGLEIKMWSEWLEESPAFYRNSKGLENVPKGTP